MTDTSRRYLNYTRFVLVFIFLVILAGGIVRTTQSGMGCPDWPRCFGMWIPPTNASQLPPDFEKYLDKQDIDHTFNAFHTWIEYINRLLGALLGFLILFHVVWSFKKYFSTQRNIFWLSFFLLIATGFQGWLGKKVVDANLAAVKVTTHMLVASLIAIIPVIIIHKIKLKEKIYDTQLKWLVTAALAVFLIQIIMGTDVREQIDEIARSLNYTNRNIWIQNLNGVFKAHEIVAAVAAILCVFIFLRSLNHKPVQRIGVAVLLLITAIITLGLTMANFNFPASAQPLHLLFSSVLFVLIFSFRLQLQ